MSQELQDLLEYYNPVPAPPPADEPSQPCYLWSPTTNALIVDAEGFRLKKDFYVKELAFYNTLTKEHWVGTFKPPFDRQYLKKKYVAAIDQSGKTGLKWEEGAHSYNVAFTMLTYYGSKHQLYAKGKDICNWIQQHTSLSVVDVDELTCPSVDQLPFGSYCVYHNSLHTKCALDQATRIGQYLNDMFEFKMPVVEEPVS